MEGRVELITILVDHIAEHSEVLKGDVIVIKLFNTVLVQVDQRLVDLVRRARLTFLPWF